MSKHCPQCGEPYLFRDRDRDSTEYVHALQTHEQGGTSTEESCIVASGFETGNDADIPELFEAAHEAVEELHGAVEEYRPNRDIGDARESLIDAQQTWEWGNNGN